MIWVVIGEAVVGVAGDLDVVVVVGQALGVAPRLLGPADSVSALTVAIRSHTTWASHATR